jgi:hypothetical protein
MQMGICRDCDQLEQEGVQLVEAPKHRELDGASPVDRWICMACGVTLSDVELQGHTYPSIHWTGPIQLTVFGCLNKLNAFLFKLITVSANAHLHTFLQVRLATVASGSVSVLHPWTSDC